MIPPLRADAPPRPHRSMAITRAPCSAASMAAIEPDAPKPTTTTSVSSSNAVRLSLSGDMVDLRGSGVGRQRIELPRPTVAVGDVADHRARHQPVVPHSLERQAGARCEPPRLVEDAVLGARAVSYTHLRA